MDEVKKAKEKAEMYLFKIIEQEWNGIIKYDEPMDLFDYFDKQDWPLRFEAFSYVGHRYKHKINSFAREIRDLWNEWVRLNKKDLIGSKFFFWPAQYEKRTFQDLSEDLNGKKTNIKPNEIENHISMFRAKEILGIGGFDTYFDEAKNRLLNILFSRPHLSRELGDAKIIWQIVRSPFLRNELFSYLKAIAQKIVEGERYNKFIVPQDPNETVLFSHDNLYVHNMNLFFLCFGNFGDTVSNLAKKAMLRIIDTQEKNGCFEYSDLQTCLSASLIYFMELDPSNSICEKAIEYLLTKQQEDGSWMFLFGGSLEAVKSNSWKVLSTVIVLETLDLITKNEPLPIWTTQEKNAPNLEEEKFRQVQQDGLFSIPEGVSWEAVHMYFIGDEEVVVNVSNKSFGANNFAALGFLNKKDKKPVNLWRTLSTLAKAKGELSIIDDDLAEKERDNLKKSMSLLRKKLKLLFRTTDDPFYRYKECGSYKTRFLISFREILDGNSLKHDEIIEDFHNDIEQKELQQAKNIKSKRFEEIKGRKKDLK